MGSATTSIPSLKERQRAERETLILDEAERMLGEQGYNELVLEQLAERVGIGKGTIYLHFPSKEDLVAAIVLRGLHRLSEHIGAIAAGDGTAAERLQAIMETMIESSINWVQAVEGPSRREWLAAVEKQGVLSARFHELFSTLCSRVGAVIDQGKEQGAFNPAIATPVAVLLLLQAGRASGTSHLTRLLAVDRTQIKDSVMRLYLEGLSVRPETEVRA